MRGRPDFPGTARFPKADNTGLLQLVLDPGIAALPVMLAGNSLAANYVWTFTTGTAPPAWVSLSAGYYHTLARKTDGTLWAWGSNGSGQLGDGTTVDKNVPTNIL